MSVNTLYLVPFSAGDTTTSKLRVSVKTSGAENIFSAIMTVRFITDFLPPISTTGNYMTVYHAGTNNTSGLGIFLKYQNGDYYIGIRYIIKTGSTWNEVPGSFIRLADYTPDINKYPYVLMLSYNLTSTTTPNITFSMAVLDNTVKTTADFTLNYTFSSTNISNGGQWGFGSSPQSNTNEYGLITGVNYNSYSSGGCYLSNLQGWTQYIPATSGSSIFSLFNTSNNQFSIYWYILYNSLIADNTTNLRFQLVIPDSSVSNIGNAVSTPDTLATLTPSATSYSPMPNFGLNANTTASSPIVAAIDTIECIYTGMKVLTTRGYVPVDDLTTDDKLITDKYKVVDIDRIYRYFVVPSKDTLPVIIKKGTYGAIEDTYISEYHLYKVGDEFRLPKEMDLPRMTVENAAPLCYYHINVENYLEDNIVVNGVVVEAHTTSNYMWLAKQNKYIMEESEKQEQEQEQ